MKHIDKTELLDRYAAGTATEAEKALVESWYLHEPFGNALPDAEDALTDFVKSREQLALYVAPKRTKLWPRYAGIAAAAIGIAIGVYFYTSHHPNSGQPPELAQYKNDIAPGKNTAVLIVNGKQTQLSDAKAGIIVTNDIKYNDGSAVGSLSLAGRDAVGREGAVKPLTLTTPKGGTYSIILQDGTKVWLNADSKLEVIPNFWNKAQRLVKLTGEAYFEVAKILSPAGRDGRRPERVPFRVESQGQLVTVLGTHFNVSAYKGEAIRTTLLEGSVRVASTLSPSRGEMSAGQRGEEKVLKPNQQSLITTSSGITIKEVDPATVTDWKDGRFVFKDEQLEVILRKVARWYNVEIEDQRKDKPERTYTGVVSRFDNVSRVLSKLQLTGEVKFKIQGRKIYIN